MKCNALLVLAALGSSVNARFLHGLDQLGDYNQQRSGNVKAFPTSQLPPLRPTGTGTGVFPPTPPPTGAVAWTPGQTDAPELPFGEGFKKRDFQGQGGFPFFRPTGTGDHPPPPPPTGTNAWPPALPKRDANKARDEGNFPFAFPTGTAPSGPFPTDPWGPRPTSGGQWHGTPKQGGRIPRGPAVPPPLP